MIPAPHSASRCICRAAVFALAFTPLVHAQSIPKERPRARPPSALAGWADWEKGADLLRRIEIPPAPVRSPEEELATFKLAPGYRIELVAAEPLVHNPIFFEFDPDGRLWAVEYQGYMRDLAGTGEGDPICRIVVLEDVDGDGRSDKSTVFLDHMVMPRSFAFVKGGVLVQEPPTLWFCEDTDGDLRCDRKTAVGTMGVAGNPQHTANGLRYGIDNWLHNADWPRRCRWRDGKLIEEETIQRGQFGLTFDEAGRFLTCYENKALHGDLIPAASLLRNRNLQTVFQRGGGDRSAFGVNVDLAARAQEVFPIRVTPAITLGALELRDDGRLRTYTIASGICCYDGHQFTDDARGNVFVPESGGHLLGRLVLPGGIAPQAARFYPPGQEFLASTDERFRPVNARVGPDGALYIADLYHGIIEHAIFMVPWLAKQIQERHLEEGNDLGRIWRVVAENRPIDRTAPKLSGASSAGLVGALAHPNGWHRLTAQRLLVERHDAEAIPALREAARRGNASAQLHSLYTLDGLDALDLDTRLAAMASADGRVRAAAIRLCERDSSPEARAALARHASDPDEAVRLQLVLTLGAFHDPQAEALMAAMLARENHPLLFTAALSGLEGREAEFLAAWLREHGDAPSSSAVITLAARCLLAEGRPARVAALLDTLAQTPADHTRQRDALLTAFADAHPTQPIPLPGEPRALTALLANPDRKVADSARRALGGFTWPGADADRSSTPGAPALTQAHQQLVDGGRETFATLCAACHQPHGTGNPGVAPPLAGSDWVADAPERLIRIVLHGLYGPIDVNGQRWNLHMPGFGALNTLTDKRIAGVLSYVRRAWGNGAAPVEPDLVAAIRKETAGRAFPWRAVELGREGADVETGVIAAGPDGSLQLPARAATTYGQKLGYRPSLDVLAPWRIEGDVAGWNVETSAGGDYDVFVTLAADDASAGDRFRIETEGSHTIGTVESSGDYDHFREVPAGRLTLRAGANRILMRPEGSLRQELADVRALRLSPAR